MSQEPRFRMIRDNLHQCAAAFEQLAKMLAFADEEGTSADDQGVRRSNLETIGAAAVAVTRIDPVFRELAKQLIAELGKASDSSALN